MKLRIRGSSVRVRLTKTEVATLGAGGVVSQSTPFSATANLDCVVEPSGTVQKPAATFEKGCVRILLPRGLTNRWANSEEVSIKATQAIEPDRSLSILVEKDFECRHSQAEEDNDAFPNPRPA